MRVKRSLDADVEGDGAVEFTTGCPAETKKRGRNAHVLSSILDSRCRMSTTVPAPYARSLTAVNNDCDASRSLISRRICGSDPMSRLGLARSLPRHASTTVATGLFDFRQLASRHTRYRATQQSDAFGDFR